jgi:PAS domain S-box-containing protein
MTASKGAIGARILVAGDRVGMRDELVRILAHHWQVESVDDQKVALDRIVQNPPDLVITEVGIPGVDGFNLLRELRNDTRVAAVPVIALTARAGDEGEIGDMTLEADDYVVRPFMPRELVARVKAQLELLRLRQLSTRSETQLRLITDAMPAMISYVDAHQRYLFHNKAYENYFGLKGEDLRGRHVREVLGEAVYVNVRPRLESALLGHRETFENELPSRTGDVRYVEATYVPDIGSDGTVAGIFVLVLDITDHRKAVNALRESEERFRNMADHAPVMIWMTDANASCTYVGQTWCDFTGQDPQTALGRGWVRAVHPEDERHVRETFFAASARREPCRIEHRLRRKDGDYRWVMVTAAPRFGPGGEFLGYVGSDTDITDLKRVEEEIRERVRLRTAELEATNKELESFSYTVAHDLRTPLRAMHRYSEVLRETYAERPLDAEGLDFLRRIEASAKRMDVLIEGLLALTRLARVEPSSIAVDIEGAFHEALLQVEGDVSARGADVRFEGPSRRVRGDRFLFRQVLTNYLSNAVKFVPADRKPIVQVSVEVCGDQVRTSVSDNGVGFAPTARSKLFQIFERLESAREFPGTGIGLAIAKKAAERMAGRVGAEGVPGEGSRFWVELPRLEDE